MKKIVEMKTKIIIPVFLAAFMLSGCNDLLDRTPKTSWNDESFWFNEDNLRLYANGFYEHWFIGYNSGFGSTAGAHYGFQFSDDIMYAGNQTNFEMQVPTSRGGTGTDLDWINSYGGLNWNFAWVRKVNIMIDRIDKKMSGVLSAGAKNHWMGIGRFFRGMEYAGLASVFGDVPYFDREVGSAELDEMYKPRTPRNEVMDHVYDDFDFALSNVRINDGDMNVNRDVVAGFVSRWALFEGTWQKYHENNAERSRKFLELAVKAANIVIDGKKYEFDTDFRSLFGSNDLAGKKEVIFYRNYTSLISHQMASQCNMVDNQYNGPTLALVNAFICSDGSDWRDYQSDATNGNFELSNLIKTRDSRFEATFYKNTTYRSFPTALYIAKFINREGHNYIEQGLGGPPSEYTSSLNVNDYPVLRYAEVVLNWIEAKAELDPDNVTQADIDKSINAIRSRPLADEAVARGVKKTAPLLRNSLPNTPANIRGDVSQLLWEIRRERRMEFAFEYSRLVDLKRWKKYEYMDGSLNPDILTGTWVKLNELKNLTDNWEVGLAGAIGVMDMDGNKTVFDGSNPDIEGFYYRTNVVNRRPFLNQVNVNPYLAPVGRNNRFDYQTRGYELAQTKGWPQELN